MFSISVKLPKGKRKTVGLKFIEETCFTDKENCLDTARRLKKQNPDYDVTVIEQLSLDF